MSEALGALQDQSFARATSATISSYPPERRLSDQQPAEYLGRRAFAVTGDWAAAWIRLKAERLLSYASEHALPAINPPADAPGQPVPGG